MKTKKNTKFRDSLTILFTILFFLFCGNGAYFCIKKFYESLNSSLTKMNEKPIATIEFKRNMAQRKFVDRMIWDRLSQTAPVYDGDTIRTATDSEARITFVDGNIMDLGENSMAQFFLHDGKAQTNIQEGEVIVNSANAENGAVLTFGDSRVELNAGSSVGTNISQTGGAQVKVMEGDAIFKDENGAEKSLAEGKSLALDKNAKEEIIPLITVTSPHPNEKVLNFTGKNFPVEFKWAAQNLEEDDFLILEISSDKKFKKIEQRRELKKINETRVNLPNGNFYWRIFPARAGNVYCAQSKVNVLDIPQPSLVMPENRTNYSYKTECPDVRFSWTKDEWVSAFDFEVANNPQMNNPQIVQRVTTTSSIVSSLQDGTWYWRIIPYYTINNAGAAAPSEVRSFSIERRLTLRPAELIVPAEKDVLNTAQRDVLQFSWKNDFEAHEYEIQIADNALFSNPKIVRRTKTNFFNAAASQNEMLSGTWYWRVFQYDKDGDASEQSEVRQFKTAQIFLEQKLLYPPELFSTSYALINDVSFSWKTNIEGDNVFQIARDKNFQDLVVNKICNEQFFQGANIPAGNYYWRISAKNEPAFTTDPRAFSVLSPIATPVLTAPQNNALLTIRKNSAPVNFRWNVINGVDEYLVKIYHQENPRKPIYNNQFSSVNFSLNLENYAEGNYTWSVQAISKENANKPQMESALANGNFKVEQFRILDLTYPKNGTTFDGLLAMAKPGVVRWNSEQTAQNAIFTLTKRRNGVSNPIATVQNPAKEVRLPRLEPGTYYWTVRAKNKNGADISPQAPNFFVVANYIPLEETKLLVPKDKITYAEEQIQASREINFEWQTVSHATNYLFTVKKESGELLLRRSFNSNNFKIQNLLDLGEGRYVWTVQPIQSLQDGTILQEGKAVSRTFIIKLPEAEEVILDDIGTLYGM